MANKIETQVRKELIDLEEAVTAVECLGRVAASLKPDDMEDFGYVAGYLGAALRKEYDSFCVSIHRNVLPFVVDVTSVKLG